MVPTAIGQVREMGARLHGVPFHSIRAPELRLTRSQPGPCGVTEAVASPFAFVPPPPPAVQHALLSLARGARGCCCAAVFSKCYRTAGPTFFYRRAADLCVVCTGAHRFRAENTDQAFYRTMPPRLDQFGAIESGPIHWVPETETTQRYYGVASQARASHSWSTTLSNFRCPAPQLTQVQGKQRPSLIGGTIGKLCTIGTELPRGMLAKCWISRRTIPAIIRKFHDRRDAVSRRSRSGSVDMSAAVSVPNAPGRVPEPIPPQPERPCVRITTKRHSDVLRPGSMLGLPYDPFGCGTSPGLRYLCFA
ncbi:hypothetical protein V8E53_011352 [Lactarius tabidus]